MKIQRTSELKGHIATATGRLLHKDREQRDSKTENQIDTEIERQRARRTDIHRDID